MRGHVTDEKLVSELLTKLIGKLAAYEVILGKQKYLAGDVRQCPNNLYLSTDSLFVIGIHLG
jgi:hypothetical protein